MRPSICKRQIRNFAKNRFLISVPPATCFLLRARQYKLEFTAGDLVELDLGNLKYSVWHLPDISIFPPSLLLLVNSPLETPLKSDIIWAGKNQNSKLSLVLSLKAEELVLSPACAQLKGTSHE
eukprot:g66006.t1